MKHFIKTSIFIILSFFCGLFCLPEFASAASFNLTASTTQVSPGATFTITVGGDCYGRVDFKITNGSLPTSSEWIDGKPITLTVTAGSSGNVTITAIPTDLADSDANTYKPNARTVTVKIATPTPAPAPTTPTTPSTPSSNSNSSKPATTQKPTTQTPTTQSPAQNADNNQSSTKTPTSDSSASAEEGTDSSANSAEPVAENTDKPENPGDEICSESKSGTIAWIIATIFALLFFITLGVLIYILAKLHKVPQPTTTTKTEAKPKTNNKSPSRKTPQKSKNPKAQTS